MTVLLLAGTGEAQRIAEMLVERGIPAMASLAGGARAPQITGMPTRTGGFGGEAGFREFLRAHQIRAVLDATHPFAHRISRRTAKICSSLSMPYCQLLRSEWVAGPDDNWVQVAREEEVAKHVPKGATVFLATGRQTLERFANMTHATLICRQIEPPDAPFPFPGGRFLVGTPPFSVADEEALFQELKVDWLVVKNAGGDAPRSKLIAARNLGLPVAMIERPPQPDGPKAENVEAAVAWVEAL